jgi:polar amino acid transport system permease protein
VNISGLIDNFFNVEIFWRYLPDILRGMWMTIQISIAVVITGVLLGLALSLLRSYNKKWINLPIIIFVDIFRSLPPLAIILLLYFGLPGAGVSIPSFGVIWLTLSLILAAFAEEIFWAGLTSIKKGQWEASRSSGLDFNQTLAYVILPQALRLTVPPLTNRTIAITKNSALGAVIGVPEILSLAQSALSFSGNATPLMMGAFAYLIIFVPVVFLGRSLEKRFAWGRA